MTTTPRALAASTSMLSTPVPARPTTRRRSEAASSSAVTLVRERRTRASKSGRIARELVGLDAGAIDDLDLRFLDGSDDLGVETVRDQNAFHAKLQPAVAPV